VVQESTKIGGLTKQKFTELYDKFWALFYKTLLTKTNADFVIKEN